jgi:hypothetical protein
VKESVVDAAGQLGSRPFSPIQLDGVTQGDMLSELQPLCHLYYYLTIKYLINNWLSQPHAIS